jgi:hypothetical protein
MQKFDPYRTDMPPVGNLFPGQGCIRQRVYQIKTRLSSLLELENGDLTTSKFMDWLAAGKRMQVSSCGRGVESTEG